MGGVSQAGSIGEELLLGGKGQKTESPRKEDRGDTMGPLRGQRMWGEVMGPVGQRLGERPRRVGQGDSMRPEAPVGLACLRHHS